VRAAGAHGPSSARGSRGQSGSHGIGRRKAGCLAHSADWATAVGPLSQTTDRGADDLATILALCPISASIAFLNHSSRGAIRGVRAAKERRRRPKSSGPSSAGPSSPTTPLSMRRTSTMESAMTSRSRRSRVVNLLSRVTSTRTQSGPITPADETDEGDVAVEPDREGITPFRSPYPAQDVPRSKAKQQGEAVTGLEMETKWGAPFSLGAGADGPSGSVTAYCDQAAPEGGEALGQTEMDTKWGMGGPASSPDSRLLGQPLAVPAVWEARGEEGGPSGTPQLERDIKWPLYAAPAADASGLVAYDSPPPILAGPSGTPQLERDIKWPIGSTVPEAAAGQDSDVNSHDRSAGSGSTSWLDRAYRSEIWYRGNPLFTRPMW
jgi:hypothetical protein